VGSDKELSKIHYISSSCLLVRITFFTLDNIVTLPTLNRMLANTGIFIKHDQLKSIVYRLRKNGVIYSPGVGTYTADLSPEEKEIVKLLYDLCSGVVIADVTNLYQIRAVEVKEQ